MNNNTLYLISLILTSYLSFHFFKSANRDYRTKNNSTEVDAVIKKAYDLCERRNNRIDVEYSGNTYSILISNKRCIENEYRVGEFVKILYSRKLNHAIMPYAGVEIAYYLSIFFWLFPLYCLYKLIAPR